MFLDTTPHNIFGVLTYSYGLLLAWISAVYRHAEAPPDLTHPDSSSTDVFYS